MTCFNINLFLPVLNRAGQILPELNSAVIQSAAFLL